VLKGAILVLTWTSALLLTLLAVGCTPSARAVAPTAAYFHDAGQCSRQSQSIAKVRVRTGNLRTDMPLELGLNQENYAACMKRLGWTAPEPAEDPYFALAAECRQTSARRVQAVEGGNLHVQSAVDGVAYRECMRNKGVEGEVIVHPLEVK
jgi:hypothetical protein